MVANISGARHDDDNDKQGQVTIPKPIRGALCLLPGSAIEFSVNAQGEVVLHRCRQKADPAKSVSPDRFEAARGKAISNGERMI
ncbi:hypothetical protein [Pseudomonas violetae]|uniref:hypothetical protein n=1 Tax=Pseudomonas violetae TaxID=2915813 RepID=UPI003D11F73F